MYDDTVQGLAKRLERLAALSLRHNGFRSPAITANKRVNFLNFLVENTKWLLQILRL